MSEQQAEQAEELDPLVRIWVANATRTGAGSGPGYKLLPRAEAGALMAARLASQYSPDDVQKRQIESMAGLMAPRG